MDAATFLLEFVLSVTLTVAPIVIIVRLIAGSDEDQAFGRVIRPSRSRAPVADDFRPWAPRSIPRVAHSAAAAA